MRYVEVDVEHETKLVPSGSGYQENERPITRVTCSKCGQTAEAFGHSEASAKRACILLKEECPKGESNFYALPK